MLRTWPFGKHFGAPVFHLGLPLDYLSELLDGGWWRVCLGSSGEFWQVGAPNWCARMDEICNHLERSGSRPWLHGLRMLGQVGAGWPLASADSTNVALHHAEYQCAACMATRIDSVQANLRWKVRAEQAQLFEEATK